MASTETTIAFRTTNDMRQKLEAQAKEMNLTPSEVIRLIVGLALNGLQEETGKIRTQATMVAIAAAAMEKCVDDFQADYSKTVNNFQTLYHKCLKLFKDAEKQMRVENYPEMIKNAISINKGMEKAREELTKAN